MSPYLLYLLTNCSSSSKSPWGIPKRFKGIDLSRMTLASERYPLHRLPGNVRQAEKDYIDSITIYDYLNY